MRFPCSPARSSMKTNHIPSDPLDPSAVAIALRHWSRLSRCQHSEARVYPWIASTSERALELYVVALSIQHQKIPPTRNVYRDIPRIIDLLKLLVNIQLSRDSRLPSHCQWLMSSFSTKPLPCLWCSAFFFRSSANFCANFLSSAVSPSWRVAIIS